MRFLFSKFAPSVLVLIGFRLPDSRWRRQDRSDVPFRHARSMPLDVSG